MDHVKLQNEILQDPDGLGYADLVAAGADNQIAALLNAPRTTRYTRVPLGDVLIWAAQTGALARLEAGKAHADSQVATVAATALAILMSPIDSIDFGRQEVRDMFTVLVTGGVFTGAQRDALLAMASAPASRANVLGFAHVSEIDVAIALRG